MKVANTSALVQLSARSQTDYTTPCGGLRLHPAVKLLWQWQGPPGAATRVVSCRGDNHRLPFCCPQALDPLESGLCNRWSPFLDLSESCFSLGNSHKLRKC